MPHSPSFHFRVHPAALAPKPRGTTTTRYTRRAVGLFAPKLYVLPKCPDTPSGTARVQVRLPKAQRSIVESLAVKFDVPPNTVLRWCLYSYAQAIASGEIAPGPVLDPPPFPPLPVIS